MRLKSIFPYFGILVFTACLHAQTKPGQGVYTPPAGAAQKWSIDDAHRLIWQDKPYQPVCFSFTPESTVKDAPPTAIDTDAAKLKAIIDAGATAVWLVPKTSIAAEVPTAWQKIIDQLEAAGVTYGVSLGSDTLSIANGYFIAPNINRMSNVSSSGTVTFRAPKAVRAAVTFVDPHDASANEIRSVKVERGVGRYSVQDVRTPSGVVLVYPYGPLADDQGCWPDVWSEFDQWRDTTLMVLKQLKFGPGLRFFSDPIGQFTPPIDGIGLIPSNPMYTIGFEAYLREKYQTIENLMSSWSMSERDFNSFRDAALNIPLWWGNKGLRSIWNAEKNTTRRVESTTCSIWADTNGYIQASMRQAQDKVSTILHSTIADVPVLTNWRQPSAVYVNIQQPTAIDGIMVISPTDDRNVTAKSVAFAAGQVGENVRPYMLMLAQSPTTASQVAISDQIGAIPMYLSAGARSIIWNGMNSPAATEVQTIKNALQQNDAACTAPPRLLYYPKEADAFILKNQLPGGIWWVPTIREGSIVDVGPNYRSYMMKSSLGDTQVIWSATDSRKTAFKLLEPRQIYVTDAAGQAIAVAIKNKEISLNLGLNPTVFRGAGILTPQESVEDVIVNLAKLIKTAQDRKIDPQEAKYRLNQAQDGLKNGQVLAAYLIANSALTALEDKLANYLWYEPETSNETNFDDGRVGAWASGGATLRVNNPNDPQARGYYVRWNLNVAMDGQYHVWLSRRIDNSSPLEWTVDDAASVAASNVQPVGTYANGFGWYQLGTVRLAPGKHTIEVRVTKRVGGADTNYSAELDALCVTPNNLVPNGALRPSVE